MAGYDAFTARISRSAGSCRRRGAPPHRDRDDGPGRGRPGRWPPTGPFAETKEALGGIYMVDAADLDEAIALRRDDPGRHPRLRRGPTDLGACRRWAVEAPAATVAAD